MPTVSLQSFGLLLATIASVACLPARWRWAFLAVVSLLFCAGGSGVSAALALGLVSVAHAGGRLVSQPDRDASSRRRHLIAAVGALVGVLLWFRLSALLTPWGGADGRPPWEAGAGGPVGLSFLTLALAGYVHDCYRGAARPESSYQRVLLFGLFFPYLTAGPIPRAAALLPQFHEPVRLRVENFTAGLRLILWGVFKKLVVAEAFARIVERLGGDPASAPAFGLLLASYAYSFQLYTDFTAYSDIATGVARLFGIVLPPNFRRPYAAASISEFWSRWHISLSSWLRDHLYFPLGGSRVARWRHFLNVAVVFLASGLWHGAGVTFLLWGLFHAAWIIATEVAARPLGWFLGVMGMLRFPRLIRVAGIVVTFHAVTASWILFRASSVTEAVTVFRRIGEGLAAASHAPSLVFTPAGASRLLASVGWNGWVLAAVALAVFAIEAAEWARFDDRIRAKALAAPWWLRWCAYYALALGIITFGHYDSHAFIYAQF